MPAEQAKSGEHWVRDEVGLPDGAPTVLARTQRVDTYPIHVTRSPAAAAARLLELAAGAKLAIITDQTVQALHGRQLTDDLRRLGVSCQVYALPPGEASKSAARALELWDWLAESDIGRRDVIVTHGGGVINDIGGWVASAFMRGVPYVNLPSTLLAQVDGALGGKVAVNHTLAKNLLGAFYQPKGVISDISCLQTLGRRQLASGVAETIKKAVIASPAYFEFIEGNVERILAKDLDALERLVCCAAAIKTLLIERDPYEHDLRRPLNFGHSIGHPLETVTGYGPLTHGEAVAFGMVVESRIARNRGLLSQEYLERVLEVLRRAGLPYSHERLATRVDGEAIIPAMAPVSRIRAGSPRYVLWRRFGETVIVDDVSERELRRALHESGLDVHVP
jgi:3-dehydroquinate synthase